MKFLSGRLFVGAGVVLMLASLLAFSFAAPSTTVGQETDVAPPAADDGFGADVDAGADGPAAPPASLPDTGTGGDAGTSGGLGSGGSAKVLLISMLAALGLSFIGAGVITGRRAQQVKID